MMTATDKAMVDSNSDYSDYIQSASDSDLNDYELVQALRVVKLVAEIEIEE
jgi:hypothetical protein